MPISKKDYPPLILVDIQKGFDDIKYWAAKEIIRMKK